MPKKVRVVLLSKFGKSKLPSPKTWGWVGVYCGSNGVLHARCVLAGNLALLSGLNCTVESAVAVKHALPLKKTVPEVRSVPAGSDKMPSSVI